MHPSFADRTFPIIRCSIRVCRVSGNIDAASAAYLGRSGKGWGRGPLRKGGVGAQARLEATSVIHACLTGNSTTDERAGRLGSQRASVRRASSIHSIRAGEGTPCPACPYLSTISERSNQLYSLSQGGWTYKGSAGHGAGSLQVGLCEHRTERRKNLASARRLAA